MELGEGESGTKVHDEDFATYASAAGAVSSRNLDILLRYHSHARGDRGDRGETVRFFANRDE